MGTLPDQFREDYQNYGDSFFAVARLLVKNHDRQFTQSDLADSVGVSQSRVSGFTARLTDDGWITRRENRTTFEWDTEQYNPAERAATDAVLGLYRDLWAVLQAHSQTSTTLWAIFGLVFFVAATVFFGFYLAVKTRLFGDSAIAPVVYLVLCGGLVVSGLLVTAITPLQAFINRSLGRLFS